MPHLSDPRAPRDYLALAAAWRCPTCGHSLADQIGHCGESDSHLAARTQPAARAWLIGRLGPEAGWPAPPPKIGRAPYPPTPEWLRGLMRDLGLGPPAVARLLGQADDRSLRRWLAGTAPIPWSACEILAAWADHRPPELEPPPGSRAAHSETDPMTTPTHASPDWLRSTLREHGISQLAAARLLGLSPAYLRCWLMSPTCPSSRRMPARQAQRLLALLADRPSTRSAS